MNVEILSKEDQTIKLLLNGRLDMFGYQEFEKQLPHLISKTMKIVKIDLSKMDFIASIGMRSFVSLAKKLSANNGELILCNPQEAVTDIFETTGLDKVLTIVADCGD